MEQVAEMVIFSFIWKQLKSTKLFDFCSLDVKLDISKAINFAVDLIVHLEALHNEPSELIFKIEGKMIPSFLLDSWDVGSLGP